MGTGGDMDSADLNTDTGAGGGSTEDERDELNTEDLPPSALLLNGNAGAADASLPPPKTEGGAGAVVGNVLPRGCKGACGAGEAPADAANARKTEIGSF